MFFDDDVVPVFPKTNKPAKRSAPFVLEEVEPDDESVTEWYKTANVDRHNIISAKRTRSEVRRSK
jgi:hypothetical protein